MSHEHSNPSPGFPRDLAGEHYWSALWRDVALPRPVDPTDRSLRNHIRREFHEFFTSRFPEGHGRRLLEVGCARSPWLSYFARHQKFETHGLDYSVLGCEQARALLARDGVAAEVHHGDLFDPPAALVGTFDVVVSFGVIEHFDDTSGCLRQLSRLLKPGGLLYSVIPNHVGFVGTAQRLIDRQVYEMHRHMGADQLRRAHEEAGLAVRECGYFMESHFGVCNCSSYRVGSLGFRARSAAIWGLTGLSACGWLTEDLLGLRLPATRLLSPYVHCVAVRSGPQGSA